MHICYTKHEKKTYAYDAGQTTNAIKELNSGPSRSKRVALTKLWMISRNNIRQYEKFMRNVEKEINKLP